MSKTKNIQQYDLKKRADLLPTVTTLNSGIEGQIRSTSVLLMKYVSEFQMVLTEKQLKDLEKVKERLDDLYLNMAEFEKQTNSESFIVVEELIRKIDEFANEMFGYQKIVTKNNRVHNLPTTVTTKMGFILLHELLSTLCNTLRVGFKPQLKIEIVADETISEKTPTAEIISIDETRKKSQGAKKTSKKTKK